MERAVDPSGVIVIGGGLAGLVAAATSARGGHPVTVIEGARHVGGRARSRHRDGFDLNLGPHALYRTAGGLAALRRLGIDPSGHRPRVERAGVYVDGTVRSWPDVLRRDVRTRTRVARAIGGLGRSASVAWHGRPGTEWVDGVTDDDAGRALLASVARTATYSADLDLLDAGALTRQLRAAMHGVRYLDGGWSSLVEALVAVVTANGGHVLTGVPADDVVHDDAVHAVRLADGRELPAGAVVVAVNDPRRAAALLHGDAAERLRDAAAAAIPVRVAHLDVALRPLPNPRFPNVLGVDEPIYVTVPSDVARVAPPDGAVVQVARYLRPGEEAHDHRALLESVLDAHQPGWRDHVVDARYVPRSLVSGDHARADTRGTLDRPTPSAAGVDGLAVAGDWVGPRGTLADASILSGVAAAGAAVERLRRVGRRDRSMSPGRVRG